MGGGFTIAERIITIVNYHYSESYEFSLNGKEPGTHLISHLRQRSFVPHVVVWASALDWWHIGSLLRFATEHCVDQGLVHGRVSKSFVQEGEAVSK